MGAIRLFLALVVAIGHYKFYHSSEPIHFPAWLTLGMNGGTAVIFFFVISGFLISYILEHKYAYTLRGTLDFYRSRFVRIYSLYWPVYVFAAVFVLGVAGWADRSFIDNFLTFILYGSDWRLSFAAYPEKWGYYKLFMHGTAPAWTLATELTFYLIAPYVLRSITAVLSVFVLTTAVRVALVYAFGFYEVWTYYFFPSVLMFFLLGHLSRLVFRRFPIDPRYGCLFLIPAFGSSMLGVGKPFDSIYFYASVLSFAAAVPSLFELTKNSRLLNMMGHLSYPVYLTHALVLVLYPRSAAWSWFGPVNLYPRVSSIFADPILVNVTVALIVSTVYVAAALIAYLLVEKPMGWLMHRALRDRVPSPDNLARGAGISV